MGYVERCPRDDAASRIGSACVDVTVRDAAATDAGNGAFEEHVCSPASTRPISHDQFFLGELCQIRVALLVELDASDLLLFTELTSKYDLPGLHRAQTGLAKRFVEVE